MEKVVVGQKVVRTDEDQEHAFFKEECRAAGIDPKGAFTVTSVSHSGKWLGLDGLTVEGESHPWKRNNFEPFIEPDEDSPAVVFTRAATPITIGCVVRRSSADLTTDWIAICEKNGVSILDTFTVEKRELNRFLTLKNKHGAILNWMFAERFEVVEQTQKADADGWIEWHGGECPVGNDVLVDYRLRDNFVFLGSTAIHLRWGHEDVGGDILAYRPHVKEKTEEQKLRDRVDIIESGYNEEINKRINAEREASEKISKLESQLTDERHERMKREQLVERLRVILGENGREFKALKADHHELQEIHCKMAIEIDQCNQVIANHSRLMQAQDVVIEQSRDNVKLALVLAASPEVNGDAVDYLARLVRKDEQDQTAKIVKLINDRYVVDLPF